MAYRDFQHFLEVLESKGELKRIKEPVSPYLEITEIADRVMKMGGPALLFENVAGAPHRLGSIDPESAVMGKPSIHPAADPKWGASAGLVGALRSSGQLSRQQTGRQAAFSEEQDIRFEAPVAINTMGSRRRMSLALGVEDFEEHAERLEALLKPELPNGPIETLKMLPQLFGEIKNAPPKTVSYGAVQEVVMQDHEVDLTKLPILTCWPEDAGPFITLPLVFTHDPNTGKRNVGMYRMQLYDKNTTGMHWQMHKSGMRHMENAGAKGQNIEVAVALGGDPALTFSAIAPLPPGIDEMMFAGFLRKDNVRMVQAKTVDLKVPADAEIILEGYVNPAERRLEGPFGDHTGYYSLAEDFPVFHVTCVTRRKKPIYPATIVGIPPMEDAWMGKAVERIFLPLIKMTVPELVDMNLPVEACFHNVAFVSIRKKYPGHAYKAMNAIWGLGGLAFTKFVFIFDEDCNVQDFAEVLFRIGANCDPGRDALPSRGPVDQLDHASQQEGFGGKIGFDCTHKWPGENGFSRPFPKLITMADDVKQRIDEMWPKLGL
ncbi:MAG: 4-hydroxy-3-polyprenylbenzoate decarboxylase [Fimbriimonadaceae bacterium]|jgi:4-hydroxy-3-polyprenylbenzoate decarboxylase|nr:4-hydroxy-3-polyprenylbenzoate decarboxylase [Fimbriimonadaceae bacterium]